MDKKKKSRIIIITTAALVFVCFFVYFNFGNIMKAANPEAYLKLALANTAKNIYASSMKNASPNEQAVSMKIDELGGNVPPQFKEALEGLEVNLITQTDIFSSEINLTLDAATDSFEFKGNKLYASPEIIAVKSPYFYSAHEYITIDPNAFSYEVWEIIDKIAANMVFGNNGKTETAINNQAVALDKMSYTVPREAVNEIYRDIINMMKKRTNGGIFLPEKIVFTDDLAVNFYIDKKHRVVKAEISEFQISGYSEKHEQEATALFGFYIDLFGNKSLLDGVSLAITAKSGNDDYTIAFNSKNSLSKNVLSEKTAVSVKSGNIVVAKLACDTDWAQETKDGNFKTKLTGSIGFNQAVADITGNLINTGKPVETPDLSDSIDAFELTRK